MNTYKIHVSSSSIQCIYYLGKYLCGGHSYMYVYTRMYVCMYVCM